MTGFGDEPTCSANFYPRLQRRLHADDTLVIETGTCMLHLNGMLLPAAVSAEEQACGDRSVGEPQPPWASRWRRSRAAPCWSPVTAPTN